MQPPARKSKLSEIKAITLPESFLRDLPESKKRSKRRGLKIVGEGLNSQKIHRLKVLQKEIANRIIIEETKKDENKRDERKEPAKSPKPSKEKPKAAIAKQSVKGGAGEQMIVTE